MPDASSTAPVRASGMAGVPASRRGAAVPRRVGAHARARHYLRVNGSRPRSWATRSPRTVPTPPITRGACCRPGSTIRTSRTSTAVRLAARRGRALAAGLRLHRRDARAAGRDRSSALVLISLAPVVLGWRWSCSLVGRRAGSRPSLPGGWRGWRRRWSRSFRRRSQSRVLAIPTITSPKR